MFNYETAASSTGTPYGTTFTPPMVVGLSMATDENNRSILFDAIRWRPAGSSGSNFRVDAYLVSHPEGARVRYGETVTHCFRIVPPTSINIRYWYIEPEGQRLLSEWLDNGQGKCYQATPSAPAGRRTLRIEAWNSTWTRQLVEADETYFDVVDNSPTSIPPTNAPPTGVPSATRRPEPTPTSLPEPRWVAVIVPGYGNSLPFSIKEN